MKNHTGSKPVLKEIEILTGYRFRDKSLGTSAITTRAYSNEHPDCPDNEALEYLGDAVLSLVIAELLYEKWPRFKDNESFKDMTPESVMTNFRKEVVNREYLKSCADAHNLCEFILEVPDKMQIDNNGHIHCRGDKIVEALIAAIYLDNDKSITEAKKFILKLLDLSPLLNDEKMFAELVTRKNPKDRLIHKFQKLKKITASVEYPVIEDRLNREDNTHHFILGISIDGILLPGITGEGSNKHYAEYDASKKAYAFLEKNGWDLSKIK